MSVAEEVDNMSEKMDDKDFLISVAKELRNVCDGAKSEDGVGFNKYDASYVRGILRDYEEYDNLSIGKWKGLKKSLIKYKGQIKGFGYDYSRIPQMSFQESVKHDEVKVELQTNGDTELHINTPYNKKFVNDLKERVSKYNRNFVYDTKTWVVTVKPNTNDAEESLEVVEEHFDVEIDINIPEVDFGTVTPDDDRLVIDTYYDKEFVNELKDTFGDREYDSNTKNWFVNFSSSDEIEKFYDLAEKWSIDVDSEAQIWIDERKEKIVKEEMEHKRLVKLSKQKSLESDYEVPLPNDDLELYDFQKYAVKMMDEWGSGLIADEMGTGKTVEVLSHLYNKPNRRPTIVVVPSSVKINWKREILKWTEAEEDDIAVLRGYDGDFSKDKSWYVVNYAILSERLEDLQKVDYQALVFDESHYIKNHKAQRTEASLELAKKTEHIYCLSGTPMPNRPIELWTQLKALDTDDEDFQYLWGNDRKDGFAEKYCNARKTKWGWDVNGKSNLNELYRRLREAVMVRRKKEDVIEELPDKRRITVPLELSNRNEYIEAVDNFREWMSDEEPDNEDWKKAEHLAKIEKLKQLAVDGKKEEMFNWLDDMVEQTNKLVVFAHHTDIQDEIYQRYEDISVKITGGMDSDARQDVIDEFTDGNAEMIVLSLIAGGEGINLQVANRVVFTEINWTPKEHNQAEDRIHRIGQEDRCDVYYLLSERTIEEDIFDLINEKQKAIDEAIDGVTDESQQGMLIDIVEIITENKE